MDTNKRELEILGIRALMGNPNTIERKYMNLYDEKARLEYEVQELERQLTNQDRDIFSYRKKYSDAKTKIAGQDRVISAYEEKLQQTVLSIEGLKDKYEQAVKRYQECDRQRREKELENLELRRESGELKDEIDRLKKLEKWNTKKIEKLKNYLRYALADQNYKGDTFVVQFRRSRAVKDLEESVLEKLPEEFIAEKKIRKLGAVLRHREVGFKFNALCAWEVPAEKLDAVAKIMSAHPAVSHCYDRNTAPNWNYNLYTMIHAKTREECDAIIAELSRSTGVENRQVLYSKKEWKKTSAKYF